MTQLEIQSASSEYLGALRSVRLAKTVAWLVILLALATQATSFVLAICTSDLDAGATPGAAAPAATARSQPASAPAVYDVDLHRVAGSLLPITKFAGLAAALALAVLLLAAMQISLAGHLGGAKGFSSAFVWSIVLLLTLVPWQEFFAGMLGAGVLVDFSELQAAVTLAKPDWIAGKLTAAPAVAYMCRFFAYPFIVLLFWIIVGLRFAQGMRAVRAAATVAPSQQQ
jgi:hypothetical protein